MQDVLKPILNLLQPGTVTLLAGQAGGGKTTLAFYLAAEAARICPVVTLSYEPYVKVRRAAARMPKIGFVAGYEGDDRYIDVWHEPEEYAAHRGLLAVGELLCYGVMARVRASSGAFPKVGTVVARLRAMVEANPELAVLTWLSFPPHVSVSIERAGLHRWVEEIDMWTAGGVTAAHHAALVKPVGGWDWRKSRAAQQGGMIAYVAKPEPREIAIPPLPSLWLP
ncbi:MAG: hypothetical protein IMX02_02835 [Limnochordaceae bacterium]|nr:hypothetical protein [Limnochordaceae bacterium]